MSKRLGSPSRPESPGGKKQQRSRREVGIISHSMTDDDYYEIKLYVVDIDLQSSTPSGMIQHYPHAHPTLQIIFPSTSSVSAVCVLKSTLYVFGEYASLNFCDNKGQKYAKKFVLSEAKGNCLVKEEQLPGISVMNSAKTCPRAIPTPDGQKILVFGNHVRVNEFPEAFEVYDPQSDTWDVLPGLPCSCYCTSGWLNPKNTCRCYYEIICYSFIGDSHFYVETKQYGSFVLHLGEKKWSALGLPLLLWDDYFFTTKDGEYVFTTKGTWHIDGGILSENPMGRSLDYGHEFTLSTFAPPNTPEQSQQQCSWPSILSLQLEGEEQVCCILQMETYRNEHKNWRNEARILIDVCRTDLTPPMKTATSNCMSLSIDFLPILYDLTLISL